MAQSQAEQQAQAQIAGEPTRTKERQPQPATGTAADPTAQAQQNDEQGGLERKMETRHLTMISLGGVIGTGLIFKLRLHHPPSRSTRCDYRLCHRFRTGLLHHAESWRTLCGHAVRRQLPPVREAFHRPRHCVHHRRALLAELGGGARLRIHRRGPADATLVPAFARMDLVGRVHRGRVPAQHPVGAPVRRIGILVRVHQGVRHHRVHYHRPARHVRRDSNCRL